jgi:hypothetical protein
MRNNRIDTSKLVLLPVPEGYKLHLHHFTKKELILQSKSDQPPPRYGTKAELFDEEGNSVCIGFSFCSHKDTPNRKLGNIIAHNRCIKKFNKQNAAN